VEPDDHKLFPPLSDLTLLIILIAISSLALLPLWREATRTAFANRPEMRQLPGVALKVLLWLSCAIDAAWGFILGVLGLRLSALIGIKPFRILSLLSWAEIRSQMPSLLMRALKLGLTLFLITVVVTAPQLVVFGMRPPAGTSAAALSKHRAMVGVMTQMLSAKGALAAGIGIPIIEEVEFRLFLIALIAWLCVRRRIPRGTELPKAALIVAIVVSGCVFGLAHIASGQGAAWWRPWYLQILTDPRGYLGVVLGYLYWRWGIETTIIAHSVWNVLVIGVANLALLVL
jgi:membrane protease YdiL (CAAX protease family)